MVLNIRIDGSNNMKRIILVAVGLALVLLFVFPITVGAVSGQDALQGLIEVIKGIIEAYTEYLGAL